MKWPAKFKIAAGVAQPDPRTNPGDVPSDKLYTLPSLTSENATAFRRVLLSLEGTAGNTVTVEVWCADDATLPSSAADNPSSTAALQARRFYGPIAVAFVVTVGAITEITAKVPPDGVIYVRRTADTLAAGGGTLLLRVAP